MLTAVVGFIVFAAAGSAPSSAATFAESVSVSDLQKLYPKGWAPNVAANWPVIQRELVSAGYGDDRNFVIYALATIRVETSRFSPHAEYPSRHSRKPDKVGYAGAQGASIPRDYGAYDSTLRVKKNGKVSVNKDLGNCYYRGRDDDLMRSRHGDPPLPPCDDGQLFRGRGFVQITGRANYIRMNKLLAGKLGFDLVKYPERAGDTPAAARILVVFLGESRARIDGLLSRGDLLAARKVVNSAGLAFGDFQRFYLRAQTAL